MYPPKVTDKQVQRVVQELAAKGDLPSGAAVRAALERQFGSRGGVARIYRLLAAERARLGSKPLSAVGLGLLELENSNLREQLKHARQREDAHQVYWDREVGQLRARVHTLELLVQRAAAAGEVGESLRKEVQGVDTRAGQLEIQVRTFGPAAGRIKASE